jgi:D-aspartate ligase
MTLWFSSMFRGPEKQTPGILILGNTGLLRSFGEAGLKADIGARVGSYSPESYSRYCRQRREFSEFSSDAFIEELLAYGKRQNSRTYIALDSDPPVLAISENREVLSPYFSFILSEKEIIRALIDKTLFSQLAVAYQLPVPRTFALHSVEDFDRALLQIQVPCIMKPAQREDWQRVEAQQILGGRRKALLIFTQEELANTYKSICRYTPSVVVQEYVPGDDQHLYSLHALLDYNSKVVSYVLARKIRTYPIHFGIGSYAETVSEPNIAALALDALQKIRFQGLASVNLKKDSRTGEVKILEVNPRNSLWCYLDAFSGNNLAVMAYCLASGQQIPGRTTYHTGVRWLYFKNDCLAFLQYRKARELTLAEWLQSFKGRTAFHVFSFRDPLPFLVGILQFSVRRAKSFFNLIQRLTRTKALLVR